MLFLKPNTLKIKITGIFILAIMLFSICGSASDYLINKSAKSSFEKLAKVELDKEAKPLIEKLNKLSFDGVQFNEIYFKSFYLRIGLSIILALLFSYLGSCVICNLFINQRTSGLTPNKEKAIEIADTLLDIREAIIEDGF